MNIKIEDDGNLVLMLHQQWILVNPFNLIVNDQIRETKKNPISSSFIVEKSKRFSTSVCKAIPKQTCCIAKML